MRLACTAALSLVAAACGAGDSGNVMAAGGNALSPEQVDAALGPDIANVANDAATANELNTVEPAVATGATEAPSRSDEEPQADREPEPEDSADEPAPTENSE